MNHTHDQAADAHDPGPLPEYDTDTGRTYGANLGGADLTGPLTITLRGVRRERTLNVDEQAGPVVLHTSDGSTLAVSAHMTVTGHGDDHHTVNPTYLQGLDIGTHLGMLTASDIAEHAGHEQLADQLRTLARHNRP